MGLSCQTSKRWKHVAFESVLLAWHTCLLSLSWIWPKISLLFPGKNMCMLQSNPAGMRSCVHLIGIMCFNKPSNRWIYEPKWTVLSLSSFCRVAPLLWAHSLLHPRDRPPHPRSLQPVSMLSCSCPTVCHSPQVTSKSLLQVNRTAGIGCIRTSGEHRVKKPDPYLTCL